MESSMTPNATPGTSVGTPPQPGIFSLMVGVFTSPAKTFEQFSGRPQLLVPLMVVVVLMAVGGAVGSKYNSMAQYEMMKKSTTLPAQVLEEMRQSVENPDMVTGAITAAVVIVVIGVLAALLAWFMGTFVFGGQTTFKGVWGVGVMGGLITVLGGVVKLPLMIARDSVQVTLGLAALMPGKDFTSVLYSLLFYLDIFAVWAIIVTGIGYAAAFGISRGKGIATSVVVSLVFIGLLIGLTAFGLSMAGVEISFV
jgi:hypothetical protein